ncbi:hypothetical protein HMF8227_02797 [Saliniradius amylolyticus]|uniref:Uncharacterized protein n=1 Tax=Saliniradius amylolyticus TaxID=2183582 RepID=A0A2S2E6F5_9ALTE|nr:hypothetical protein [Saliniradius amylolyticus]AWL13246.1 hypothetical protein HMF8227_02797 [Saliniradius amylolyticus]
MVEKRRVWAGVSAALLGTVATSNTAMSQDNPILKQESAIYSFWEGEGEGEGEGGSVDLRSDHGEFLARLGLVRGHLWIGMQLYQNGHTDMAKTHMKHPKDELYSALVPAFKARNLPGFAEELTALSQSVMQEADPEQVEINYQALQQAISQNEQVDQYDAETVLISIAKMLRTSADEYAIGVEQGELVNAHEYQDALGFKTVALARLNAMNEVQKSDYAGDLQQVRALIDDLSDFWPDITPEGELDGDISRIYATAARVELIGMNL